MGMRREIHNKIFNISNEGRECNNCFNWQEWSNFRNSKNGINQKAAMCKTCMSLVYDKGQQKSDWLTVKFEINDAGRKCIECFEWKKWDEITARKDSKGFICLNCNSIKGMQWKDNEKIRKGKKVRRILAGRHAKQFEESKEKPCAICNIVKPLGSFPKGNSFGGRHSNCNECRKIQHREKMEDLFSPNGRAKMMIRGISQRAKLKKYKNYYKNIPINLKPEDLLPLPLNCPVLNVPLDYWGKNSRTWRNPCIDRIIPKKGYVKGNVIVISDLANRIKNDASPSEIKKVYEWLNNYYIKNNITEQPRDLNQSYNSRSQEE